MKKLTSFIFCATMVALSIAAPKTAKASFYGDSVTITGQPYTFSPGTLTTTSVVGDGAEFTYLGTDDFDQEWTIKVDVLSDAFKVSFSEATMNGKGNIFRFDGDMLTIDISFDHSDVTSLVYADYTSNNIYSTGSNINSLIFGTKSVHVTFATLLSGDVYIFSTTPVVPEPTTYAMLLAGLGLVGFVARRRQKRA